MAGKNWYLPEQCVSVALLDVFPGFPLTSLDFSHIHQLSFLPRAQCWATAGCVRRMRSEEPQKKTSENSEFKPL
jgi:hypothetical protein